MSKLAIITTTLIAEDNRDSLDLLLVVFEGIFRLVLCAMMGRLSAKMQPRPGRALLRIIV